MKTKIFVYTIFMFIVSSVLVAQSDYKTLQDFKTEYKQIQISIKHVSSLEECNSIEAKIAGLNHDFVGNKALLDKALYPEDFESSFTKIEDELASKKKDFSQITDLTTKVASLQTEVASLNQKNEELLKQISDMKAKAEKDEAAIGELKRLVGLLRVNINQRDMLVRDLVDSLLVEFIKSPQNLSQREAKTIVSKVKKENLFYNIERTIADNIQFTKVTQMTADDFAQMKKQYNDFDKVWKRVGPRLSAVYLSTKQRRSEIPQIDSLFMQWNNQINVGIWKSINDLFVEKNIYLTPFNNGEMFVKSVGAFVDNEIQNIGVKSRDESVQTFHNFADDVYSAKIESKWMPILMENNMLTVAEKSVIDMKLENWSAKISTSTPYWIFIIAGVIVLATLIFLLRRLKKPSVKTDNVPA